MTEYISREEVLKAFRITAKNSNKDYQRGLQDAIDCLVPEVIADIPTADAQPVKHGRWLPSDSCITAAYGTIHCQICSECGADLMEDSDYDYDFCPVCGARMDLKDGEQNG